MKAIILAAGRGRRLKGIDVRHKSLLKINNLSLIKRQIKILKQNGVSEIWIVTGHNAKDVEKELNENGVKFLYNKNYEKTDTLESFLIAKHVIDGELITLYADVIFEEEILQNLLKLNELNIVLSIQKEKCQKDDMKTFVSDDIVKRIDKNLEEKLSNSKYIGLAKFSKKGSAIFKNCIEKFENKNSKEGDISRVFEEIVKEKSIIFASFTNNIMWVNVNTLDSFKKAKEYFESKTSNTF